MSNPTPIVFETTNYELPAHQKRALLWTLYIGYLALVAGVFHGLAQALSYANIDILQYFPILRSYYQGLTAHGVANVLIFTFSFSNAFLPLMTARALSRPLNSTLLWASFGTLVFGNILTVYAIVSNQASVLYTSYAPLQAHWTYYVGLVFVVISTWLSTIVMLLAFFQWRREHPGMRVPLLAFISVVSYVMWFLASLPLAVSFLGFMIPWSIGILPKIDPLLTRTLFWFTAHAIVYAWLLPAYISWYVLVPRQAGGKVVSDSLTRFAFILFLILSIPTGFHHQYTDPGISNVMKGLHGVLTFGVFFPSLATAFSVMAALEMGGRAHGGKGLLGWILKLPWGDPSLTAQLLAMITFVFGGITGLINASLVMNQVIHNTTWVPGHFHMTVGSAVALTLVGVAYWLIPYLTGRGLWNRPMALASSWIYTIGVLIFARGMVSAGLEGMPRRFFRAADNAYDSAAWDLGGILTGVGGTLMFVGIMLFFVVIAVTIFFGRKGEHPRDIPWSETLTAPALTGWQPKLDQLKIWIPVAIVLVIIAYGPFLVSYLPPRLLSQGYQFW
ncbi:MAG: cytochrome c oxidase subunit I [Chloroflexi bacterium AL-W]|nr:cytochrome c oxidase subunit I [Chloroflexi bacterium AL-N1]NOK69700.1 cytochrome c oxidase subunit I [Chloroflexi bacterium AL-N10]NOK72247.1 cytochrome c oxidase subunit I [Chloroflexi bacterium AL-N5]NOK85076.1 cytochrome c oxidase subunit I [Chloroflexi bacterium AL-W]NOK91829.1 cytochrome c oxidase subunit I [Chloroflexi bacterium AL-N15]